jgi:hypothetical protein
VDVQNKHVKTHSLVCEGKDKVALFTSNRHKKFKGLAPLILHLGSRWKTVWSGSCLGRFNTRGKNLRYLINTELGTPLSGLDVSE